MHQLEDNTWVNPQAEQTFVSLLTYFYYVCLLFKLNCVFIILFFFWFICVAYDGGGKGDPDDVVCLQFLVSSCGQQGDHFGVGSQHTSRT